MFFIAIGFIIFCCCISDMCYSCCTTLDKIMDCFRNCCKKNCNCFNSLILNKKIRTLKILENIKVIKKTEISEGNLYSQECPVFWINSKVVLEF